MTGDQIILKLQIFDLPDDDTIIGCHYRTSHGVIICIDLSDQNAFQDIEKRISEAKESVDENCRFLLVGTKSSPTGVTQE